MNKFLDTAHELETLRLVCSRVSSVVYDEGSVSRMR